MSDLYEEDEYDFDVAEIDADVASKSSKRAQAAQAKQAATATAAVKSVALAAADEYADEFEGGVSKSSANAYGDDAFEEERSVSRARPSKPVTAARASTSVSTKAKPAAVAAATPIKATALAADADDYDVDDFDAESTTRPASAVAKHATAAVSVKAAAPSTQVKPAAASVKAAVTSTLVKPAAATANPATGSASAPTPVSTASTSLKPAAAASAVTAVAATPVPAAAKPSPPVSSPRTLEPSYSQEHLPTASSVVAAASGPASKPRPSDDGPVDYDNHAGSRPMSARRPESAHPSRSRPTSAHPSNSRPTSAATVAPAASASSVSVSTKLAAAKPPIPTVPKPATVAVTSSTTRPVIVAAAPSAAPTLSVATPAATAVAATVPKAAAPTSTTSVQVAAAKPTTPTPAPKLAAATPVVATAPVTVAPSIAAPAPVAAAPSAVPAASPSASALTNALLAAAGGVLPLESAGSLLVRDEDDDGDYDDDDDFEEAIAKAQKAPSSAVNLSASRPTQPLVAPTSFVAAKPTPAVVAPPSPLPLSPKPVVAPTSPVTVAASPDAGTRAVPSSKKVAPAAAPAVVVAPSRPPASVAPKTAPAPRKPPAASSVAAPPSPVAAADPKKAAEYDRARREIMKAQRLKDAAEAKEKAKAAAKEMREKNAAAAAAAAQVAEAEEKEEEVKRSKAPIQPPPAFSPPTSPLAGRTASPSRTQPRAPSSSARKGQHQIHPHVAPPPWEHAAAESTQWREEVEEEEKQQFSPRTPHSPTRSRARPPRYGAAATARPGTAASNSSFAPFSPSSSTARPSTSAGSAAFRVADAWSLHSGRRRPVDGSLETQRLVHRAAEILRAFSETDPSPLVTGPPFQPLQRPVNATQHADVPRCYPRGAVQTPRVSTARFKRTRAFNGGLTGPQPHYHAQDRSAAINAASAVAGTSASAHKGSWDVSAELSYGHAIIEGLRARTQTLASAVESRGINMSPHPPPANSVPGAPAVSLGLPPRPSSAQHQAQHHSDLLQSLAVTSSLESYYSLLSRLDISVQQSQQHDSKLHQLMFQPTISVPPQPPPSQQQTQPKRSPGSTRPGSAVPHYHHASNDASQLAAEQESGWVHSSSASGGQHAEYSLKRPTSGRRTHPLAPPSQIPPYDSLLDPHVRSVLGPTQRRVIESTRQEELQDAPELRGMYETRSRNFDEEREVEESLRAEEIKRKRRQDRPQEERISQRPRSATGTATASAASHKKQSKPAASNRGGQTTTSAASSAAIPPAPKAARDMHTRIKQVSSAYAAGNSAALPPGSKPKARRPVAAASAPKSREDDKYGGIEIRDEDDPAEDADDDEEEYLPADQTAAPAAARRTAAAGAVAAPVFLECDTSLIVDWHSLSSLWASDDASGLLDRELASLGLLGEAAVPSQMQSGRSSVGSSQGNLSRDFFSAERCLQSLHAQLGLPFEVSAPSPDFAPSLRHVAALKSAVSGMLECKGLVVRIIETIGLREQIVRALNAGASAAAPVKDAGVDSSSSAAPPSDLVCTPLDLLSQLAQADTALLDLLADYSAAFLERFGERAEFCPPPSDADSPSDSPAPALPFVFRGEDYGVKVSRERAQLLHFYNAGREVLEEGGSASRPASSARARSAPRSRGDRVRSAARERRAAAEAPLPAPSLSSTDSSEAAIAHLAATHLRQRPPAEIASAAAAIVLGTLAQQARQQHTASRQRGIHVDLFNAAN